MAISYKDSGVDVERGYRAVELIKKHIAKTATENVLGKFGSFGGLFCLKEAKLLDEPVLVTGTDGVGTKLKYAFLLNKHDTVGTDLVAMCVNDIICHGAKPLFFLDYIASGKISPEKTADIVKGIADGCVESGASLVGGETAEMPGFYKEGEYDLAGFTVGLVDKKKIIDGANIKEGDSLIAIKSSGLHSNGFSLVRKLFSEDIKRLEGEIIPKTNKSLADEVLTPTKIYVKTILSLIEKVDIKGIANITGGGLIENVPRIFPKGIGGVINTKSYKLPPVFSLIKNLSGLDNQQLYNTFNMGIGMVVCVDKKDEKKVIEVLEGLKEEAFILGKTIKGEGLYLE